MSDGSPSQIIEIPEKLRRQVKDMIRAKGMWMDEKDFVRDAVRHFLRFKEHPTADHSIAEEVTPYQSSP